MHAGTVEGRSKNIDGRVVAVESIQPIIEHANFPFIRRSLRNPEGVVLTEEHLLTCKAAIVRRRISPAVQQIAPTAMISADVPCRGLRGGAVIDDPHFA